MFTRVAASGQNKKNRTPIRCSDLADAEERWQVRDDRARWRSVRFLQAHVVSCAKLLVEHNQLEAVISLPSGVFKPYAGVSTGILVFTKGGRTDDVFFYNVEADGYSLDDKRDPVTENDLPDCLKRWRGRDSTKDNDRTEKAFFVSAEEIRKTSYDLSPSRYNETDFKEEDYDPPHLVLSRIKSLNSEIASDLAELEGMLS